MKFNFIKAKLFGFTGNHKILLKQYLDNDYEIYARSIILSKEGKLKESMRLINILINSYQNNIFLLETKADILYSNGYNSEALLFYEAFIEKKPNNEYVKRRIFDIKFIISDLDNKQISIKIFNDFIYLNTKFTNDMDLKYKLNEIAVKNNMTEWVKYFSIHSEFYDNIISRNKFINKMKTLKKNSNNTYLLKSINLDLNA